MNRYIKYIAAVIIVVIVVGIVVAIYSSGTTGPATPLDKIQLSGTYGNYSALVQEAKIAINQSTFNSTQNWIPYSLIYLTNTSEISDFFGANTYVGYPESFPDFLNLCKSNNITTIFTSYVPYTVPKVLQPNETYVIEDYNFWYNMKVTKVGTVSIVYQVELTAIYNNK